MEKLFERAVRSKLRFNYKGLISVEDLWDLSLEQLDSIYKELNAKLKETKGDSLLGTNTTEDTVLQLKIDIIKYIVSVKLEEKQAKVEEVSRKQQKDKILSIIAAKEDEDLQNKSKEELEEMLNQI